MKKWWKEVVIYQIYPRSFKDSNGDGIGDLPGILEKLDYLAELGVDVLWLSPVYSSPNDDNGYDISDYYNISPDFGTMADFDRLLAAVHERGMKLLMDLVVNHSSDEHPWFQASRREPDGVFGDFYYWRKELPSNWPSFFGGPAWSFDELRGAYYLHLFSKKQPDLNWENPAVRKEVYQLMRWWLDKGIDGFRMDVISVLSKDLAFPNAETDDFNQIVDEIYTNGPRLHEFLQEMNREVLQHYDIMTVGEGPGISKELAPLYVGKDRGELNMLFHFGHMFMEQGPGGRFDPIPLDFVQFKKVFAEWDRVVDSDSWINIFLDNHDFPRMVSRFGNDDDYRVESAKLLATLLFTLRGTPCIYQGSEIGMTNVAFPSAADYRDIESMRYLDRVAAEGGNLVEALRKVQQYGRDNARTPMQWNDEQHGGFSDGDSTWININPNFKSINVAADRNRPDSIYRYYQRMIAFRKENPVLIYGALEMTNPDHPHLFTYYRRDVGNVFFVALNFSDEETAVPDLPSSCSLEISNYEHTTDPRIALRPWEARVYAVLS